MCQAISEGGRRCPVHRNSSIVAIAIAKHSSRLPEYLLENIFNDLRREAPENPEESESVSSLPELRERISGGDFPRMESYLNLLNQPDGEDNLDHKTVYAIRNLERRAEVVKASLYRELEDISRQLGITKALTISKFKTLASHVGRHFEGVNVPEAVYSEESQQLALNKNLPTNKKVLRALYLLESEVEYGEPSVQLQDVRPSSVRMGVAGNNPFKKMGYNPDAGNGRLEIVFNRGLDVEENAEQVYVYHNVTQQEYDLLKTTGNLSVFQSRIRGKLASNEDNARASRLINCASCGQFRGNTHTCPTVLALENPEELELFREEIELPDSLVRTVEEDNSTLENPAETPVTEELSDEDISEPATEGTELEVEAETPDSDEESVRDNGVPAPLGYTPGELANRDLIPEGGTRVIRDLNKYVTSITAEGAIMKIKELERSNGETQEFIVIEPDLEPDIHEYSDDPLSLEQQAELLVAPAPEGINYGRREVGTVRISHSSEFEDLESIRNVLRWGTGMRIHVPNHNALIIRPRVDDDRSSPRQELGGINDFILYPSGRGDFEFREQYGSDSIEIWSRLQSKATKTPAELLEEYNSSGKADIELTRVDPNSTLSRTRMYREEDAISLNVGYAPVRKIRNLLNEGKAVTSELTWNSKQARGSYRYRGNRYVDDRGVQFETTDYEVTGKMSIRKTESGAIEIISGQHELRCNCWRYMRSTDDPKTCEHIGHVHRNFAKYAYSVAGGDATNSHGSRTGTSIGGINLPTAIANRNPILESPTDNEEGLTRLIFREASSRRSRRVPLRRAGVSDSGQVCANISEIISNNRNPLYTPVIESLSNINTVQSSLSATEVKRALRDVDEVEINTNISFRENFWGSVNIYNTKVVFAKNEDGEIITKDVVFRNRCRCGRFSNGNCVHETAVKDFAVNIFATRPSSFNYEDARNLSALSDEYQMLRESQTVEQTLSEMEDMFSYTRTELDPESQNKMEFIRSNLPIIREVSTLIQEGDFNAQISEGILPTLDVVRQHLASLNQKFEEHREYAGIIRNINNYTPEYERMRSGRLEEIATFNSYREAREEYWQKWDEFRKLTEADHKELCEKIASYEGIDPRDSLEELEVSDFENMGDSEVPGSRRFGVELEYVAPDLRGRAVSAVARKLNQAGLSSSSSASQYHGARRNGWTEWVSESDASVDGEVVSPILDISEKSFGDLKKALEAIKASGGESNHRVGAHVHISTGSYEGKSTKHVELFKLVQEFTPVFYRVAADPGAKSHRNARGNSYAQPLVLADKFELELNKDQLYNTRDVNGSIARYSAVNPAGSGRFEKGDHMEFRLFDGNLDYKVTQMHIAMAMYLTETAEKNIEVEGKTKKRDKSELSSISYKKELDVTDPSTTEALRGFLNLFPNQKIRDNIIKLFAWNKWTAQ